MGQVCGGGGGGVSGVFCGAILGLVAYLMLG